MHLPDSKRRHGALKATVAVVALCLITAACGSTERDGSASGKPEGGSDSDGNTDVSFDFGSSSGDTPGATDPNAPVAPGAPGSGAGGPASSSGPGRTGGGPGAGGGGGSQASEPVKPAARSFPGLTDKEINIGLVYAENPGAANAAFGAAGIGQIDGKKALDTLVAEINGRGGIAGRKIKPIFHALNGADFTTTAETRNQQVCATWTQDNKIFAALVEGLDSLKTCLKKNNVVHVSSGSALADSETFRQFPGYIQTSIPATDRVGRIAVAGLDEAGYYTPGYKLGLVRYDTPSFTRAGQALKGELERRGKSLSQEVVLKFPQSVDQQLNDETAAIRSAVLKFKTEGVTHVQFLTTNNAFVPLVFMREANNQRYNPRYGLTSNDGGQAIAEVLGEAKNSQLKGALAVGWFPFFDVRKQDYPVSAASANYRRCSDLMNKNGVAHGGDPTRNTEAQVASVCESFWFLEEAIETAQGDLSPEATSRNLSRASNFDPLLTFDLDFKDRKDGTGAIRNAAFMDDCGCYKYTTPNKPV